MNHINKNTRLCFFIISISLVILLHKFLTQSWLPTNTNTTLVFQSLVLMIVLGSTMVETKFTKPVDALTNSLLVIITLLSIREPSEFIAWDLNMLYAVLVFIFSLISMILGNEKESTQSIMNRIARFAFKLSTFFGKSNRIFSITFLLAIFSFYSSQDRDFLVVLIFWAFLIIARPVGLLALIQKIFSSLSKKQIKEGGKIVYVTFPGVIRYEPFEDVDVKIGDFIVHTQSDIKLYVVTGNYCLNDKILVQAVIISSIKSDDWRGALLQKDKIYHIGVVDNLKAVLDNDDLVKKTKQFVGVVIENSDIGEIIFRVTSPVCIEEGYILEANIGGRNVLFQIVNAKTASESLTTDMKTGVITGIAQQVGIWNAEKVQFDKYGWVPPVHTPLFLIDKNYQMKYEIDKNELVIGTIPNTNFPIIANIDTLISHHTAILGITGSGKTEMAFTLIEKMIELKAKVFCVDFTGDYFDKFKDFKPQRLAVSSEKAKELNDRLFAVETGEYGAKKELKELDGFKSSLIPEIKALVEKFIKSDNCLGIFELSEIANTTATIAITEFYLSQIFSYARKNRDRDQKFCLVLEEAHTVIPEAQTMGVQDKYSKATISRICQIALQGRKYGVGLLVIAQRTANVTKTVLNQCNSIIVFNSYDKTGYDFLENYVGPGMISAIPNLKWLHSMVVGRAFKSGRPLIMEIPTKEKFVSK